jgi:RNA polymerase sigma-70 factor (ECF subfamily)
MEDAQDLTQDFFVKILEPGWLEHADPDRGRFRSLLCKSLQNFLINTAGRTHARKRGGKVKFISWDDWMAEAPSQLSMSPQSLDLLAMNWWELLISTAMESPTTCFTIQLLTKQRFGTWTTMFTLLALSVRLSRLDGV